jgi:hypothetical protein
MNTVFEQLGLLAERGVRVEMLGRFEFKVYGFYKSDSVTVHTVNQTLTARYNEVDEFMVEDLTSALVTLNHQWWERSRERYDGWAEPDAAWKPLLLEHGYEVDGRK